MAVPKKRGFTARFPAAQVVNVSALEEHFETGAEVTASVLCEKGLIPDPTKTVKVLGDGTLTKKLTVKVQAASKSAKDAIKKAGGTFEAVAVPAKSKRVKK